MIPACLMRTATQVSGSDHSDIFMILTQFKSSGACTTAKDGSQVCGHLGTDVGGACNEDRQCKSGYCPRSSTSGSPTYQCRPVSESDDPDPTGDGGSSKGTKGPGEDCGQDKDCKEGQSRFFFWIPMVFLICAYLGGCIYALAFDKLVCSGFTLDNDKKCADDNQCKVRFSSLLFEIRVANDKFRLVRLLFRKIATSMPTRERAIDLRLRYQVL